MVPEYWRIIRGFLGRKLREIFRENYYREREYAHTGLLAKRTCPFVRVHEVLQRIFKISVISYKERMFLAYAVVQHWYSWSDGSRWLSFMQ